jgi:hypothetical protein
MKTCTNISTANWPVMPVAQAARRSRLARGYAFGLKLSIANKGTQPKASLDGMEAGR